ncbi:MAG: hypothetical protein ACK58T_49665 [Phycisphaerae bacterium]
MLIADHGLKFVGVQSIGMGEYADPTHYERLTKPGLAPEQS